MHHSGIYRIASRILPNVLDILNTPNIPSIPNTPSTPNTPSILNSQIPPGLISETRLSTVGKCCSKISPEGNKLMLLLDSTRRLPEYTSCGSEYPDSFLFRLLATFLDFRAGISPLLRISRHSKATRESRTDSNPIKTLPSYDRPPPED